MKTSALPVVDCPAEPRQRGQAHGEALRNVIADQIGRWHEAIAIAYGEPATPFLQRFLAQTGFQDAIARHVPGLMEEVTGIAEGAAIAPETAYALQLMDEEWWFGAASGHGHCSSLAIAPSGGRPTLVAQTMDLPRWHDGAQALLRLAEPDGSETLVFTSAGMIGLMGAAGRGLGVCVNTLAQLPVSSTGLPVAFVMRGALERTSLNEAAAFLRAVPHASGQNYQLGDRSGIATLECSAAGAVPLEMHRGRSLHTNHPLATHAGRTGEDSENSRRRLESLRTDLAQPGSEFLAKTDIQAALSACRPGGEVSIGARPEAPPVQSMTVGAVVFEVGETVSALVAAGPPSEEDWRTFSLKAA